MKWSSHSLFASFLHEYVYLGVCPSIYHFSFSQEKHAGSLVTNFSCWHLLFKGWYAAEERTCSGRHRPGSQAPRDRGFAAEHRHFPGAPSRYLKVLCVPISSNSTCVGCTMSSVYYSFMPFLFFKKFCGSFMLQAYLFLEWRRLEGDGKDEL